MIAMRCPPMYSDFYPRPPRGGRPLRMHSFLPVLVFLSTPSARRATNTNLDNLTHTEISIHALREEGDWGRPCISRACSISIHALREEGDYSSIQPDHMQQNFYPRPPRGGRPFNRFSTTSCTKFLSTPSARRATRMDSGRTAKH